MWTHENRGLYERKCVRYPSDLRDEEPAWACPQIGSKTYAICQVL